MSVRDYLRLLRNPFTEYIYFLVNRFSNHRKSRRLVQEYLAIVTDSLVGSNVRIFRGARVNRAQIGDYSYIGERSTVTLAEIGKFCCVGPGCVLGTSLHPSKGFVSMHPAFYSTRAQVGITFSDRDYFKEQQKVTIGNDVWIGTNVIVVDGVRIGDGAIIGAGAVVTSDVPPYAIFGGVPAKLLRFRFDEQTIARLLQTRWWERDQEWLRTNFHRFHSLDAFFAEPTLDEGLSDAHRPYDGTHTRDDSFPIARDPSDGE